MHLTTQKELRFYPPFFQNAVIKILLEPRDLWIGVYWEKGINCSGIGGDFLRLYIALIPIIVFRLDLWFCKKKWMY